MPIGPTGESLAIEQGRKNEHNQFLAALLLAGGDTTNADKILEFAQSLKKEGRTTLEQPTVDALFTEYIPLPIAEVKETPEILGWSMYGKIPDSEELGIQNNDNNDPSYRKYNPQTGERIEPMVVELEYDGDIITHETAYSPWDLISAAFVLENKRTYDYATTIGQVDMRSPDLHKQHKRGTAAFTIHDDLLRIDLPADPSNREGLYTMQFTIKIQQDDTERWKEILISPNGTDTLLKTLLGEKTFSDAYKQNGLRLLKFKKCTYVDLKDLEKEFGTKLDGSSRSDRRIVVNRIPK